MSKTKKDKMLLGLLSDEKKHRHRVAMVTEEGQWNQHEPNSGMAKMFVIMLLLHVVVIGGIIIYDFVGGEEAADPKIAPLTPTAPSVMPAPAVNAAVLEKHVPIEEYDTYEWKSGDSLPLVAQKLRVAEDTLIKINMLDKGAQIDQHTILRVPKRPVVSAIPINPNTLKPEETRAKNDTPPMVGLVAPAPAAPVAKVAPPPPTTVVPAPPSLTIPSPAVEEKLKLQAKLDEAKPVPAAIPVPTPAPEPAVVAKLAPEAMSLDIPAKEKEKEREKEKAPERKPESKPVVAKVMDKPSPVPTPSQAQKSLAASKTKETPPAKKPEVAAKKPAESAKTTGRTGHVVKSGETLYRISQKYGVSVAAIQKANGISKPESLRDGMKLTIPAK